VVALILPILFVSSILWIFTGNNSIMQVAEKYIDWLSKKEKNGKSNY